MDPITIATAFATVVSLIGQFKAERKNSKDLEASEFLSWLTENRPEEIKNLLESNTDTTISIKALLATNHEELIAKLESLDKALAAYASGVSGFPPVFQIWLQQYVQTLIYPNKRLAF